MLYLSVCLMLCCLTVPAARFMPWLLQGGDAFPTFPSVEALEGAARGLRAALGAIAATQEVGMYDGVVGGMLSGCS